MGDSVIMRDEDTRPVVLGALDKFRGTAGARELVHALTSPTSRYRVDARPMSDGGEGFVDAFDGEDEYIEVPGPLGEPVTARVRVHQARHGTVAVLETADAVGRELLRNPSPAQAWSASSAGVGHLVLAAQEREVDEVLLGCGGSASSDGGVGCYDVLVDGGGLRRPLTVATDVTATFFGARRYAAQKGLANDDMARLDERLEGLRARYLDEQGLDVAEIERTGAAGGIPGALCALGATLASGFDTVARAVDLRECIAASSLVVTGEGRLDAGSLEGKVTTGVAALSSGVPLLVVCGSIDPEAARTFAVRFPRATLVSLEDRFGATRARAEVLSCVAEVTEEYTAALFA